MNGRVEVVYMLVAVGAHKEEADNDGMTHLMEAARYMTMWR